jgi:hypothetical protein
LKWRLKRAAAGCGAGRSPTCPAASAALLERFHHIGEGQEQPPDILMDAVGLYNDWQFKEKAEALKAKLDAAEPDSEEYNKLKDQYDAYVANIQTEDLKPE